jgi:hypothetical protein
MITGKEVIRKDTGKKYIPIPEFKHEIYVEEKDLEIYKDIFENCTFSDGTPCGKINLYSRKCKLCGTEMSYKEYPLVHFWDCPKCSYMKRGNK